MAIGRFFYNVCIPINTMNFFYFKPMLDVIVAFGLGYVQLTITWELNLLKDVKKEVWLLVISYHEI